jgi:hypothetical protein
MDSYSEMKDITTDVKQTEDRCPVQLKRVIALTEDLVGGYLLQKLWIPTPAALY